MVKFQLELPNDFDDYAWEIESKGWFQAIAEFNGVQYQIVFYDQGRLSQDIEESLVDEPMFFERNLVVLKLVNRQHMENATEYLANTGKYEGFSSLK